MTTTAALYQPAHPTTFSPLARPQQKKKTMSITQTYYLAHKARAKLSHEAARSDHNLRLLVGHANLLDSLMLELADAEREQESWFNASVRSASPSSAEKERHVQWADSVVEDPEEDWQAEDAESDDDSSSDSDDDYEEEEDDIEMEDVRRVPAHKTAIPSIRIEVEDEDEEMEEDDLEEDYAPLALVRTPSHSTSSPPELSHDEDSSEDESMPPSPPTAVLPTFSQKSAAHKEEEEELTSQQESFYSEGFYLPPRNPARLVSAISVY